MKVYVASSFKLIEKVKDIVELLEENDFEITVKWWDRIYEIEGEHIVTSDLKVKYDSLSSVEFYSKHATKRSYYADFQGVKDADIFVFVADNIPRKYNGANIELGIALGDNKKCFCIGNLENSVLYYPVVKCKDKAQLRRLLIAYRNYYKNLRGEQN